MAKRRVFLVVELDAGDVAALPPHLAAIVAQTPPPIQRRETACPWWLTEAQEREKRTQDRRARARQN